MALARSTALTSVALSAIFLTMLNSSAFVEPAGAAPSTRAHENTVTQQDRYRAFAASAEAAPAQGHASSAAGVVAMAATVGLAFALVASPVYAEESASEGTTRSARKARREAARKAEAGAEKAAKSEASGGGFAFPSLPNPFAGGDVVQASKQAAPVVDADDRSPVASDPVALLLIFFTVPSIYLVFYVLGSVDVI